MFKLTERGQVENRGGGEEGTRRKNNLASKSGLSTVFGMQKEFIVLSSKLESILKVSNRVRASS